MNIDFAAFTPASAFAGGLMIGLAAALLILLNGRVAGISGIVGGLLRPAPGDAAWRIAFLAGMVLAPVGWALFAALPAIDIEASYPVLIIAGLVVGISTRYGAGCTSGHGVCGLSRLSPRSLVAVLAFMASGLATVFLIRHVFGG
ncbi:MAG: YeeE/YedE family protein [Porticoccaceae bacterium]